MSAKQDRLIAEQKTYLDMVTALEPYRRVTVSDRANAQIELLQLRAQAALLDDYAATIRQHEIRIAELEQAVSEAAEIMQALHDDLESEGVDGGKSDLAGITWLAAHAPAQPEQTQEQGE